MDNEVQEQTANHWQSWDQTQMPGPYTVFTVSIECRHQLSPEAHIYPY
jgi:hypothetical protein